MTLVIKFSDTMKVNKKTKNKVSLSLSLYFTLLFFQGNSQNQALFWWLWALFSGDTGDQVTAVSGLPCHHCRDTAPYEPWLWKNAQLSPAFH